MNTQTVDIKYYPPHNRTFCKTAYDLLCEFCDDTKWNSYGEAGFADVLDITREGDCGTAIVCTELPFLEFEDIISEFGSELERAIPGGSDNAVFLIGLPKFVWLDESEFPFMERICTGNYVTGIFESVEEQMVDDMVKIVCICSLNDNSDCYAAEEEELCDLASDILRQDTENQMNAQFASMVDSMARQKNRFPAVPLSSMPHISTGKQ